MFLSRDKGIFTLELRRLKIRILKVTRTQIRYFRFKFNAMYV